MNTWSPEIVVQPVRIWTFHL